MCWSKQLKEDRQVVVEPTQARDPAADSARQLVRGAPRTRQRPHADHYPCPIPILPIHNLILRGNDAPMKALAGGSGTSGLSELRV